MAARTPSWKVRVGAALGAFALVAGVLLSFLPRGASTTGSTTTTSTTAPTTLSDAQFAQLASSAGTTIEKAGTDRCSMVRGFQALQQLTDLSNPERVHTAVDLTVKVLVAAAGTTGTDEATAKSLRDAALALAQEGEQQAYSPQWLATPPGAAALRGDSFTKALQSYEAGTESQCGTPGSASTAPTTGDG